MASKPCKLPPTKDWKSLTKRCGSRTWSARGPSKHCENSSSNRRPSRKCCAPLRTRRTTCSPSLTPSSTAPHVCVEQTQAPYVSPKKGAFVSCRCEGPPFWLVGCGHQSQFSQKRGAFRID